MFEEFVAYTAGIVDGEGSIQINPTKNGNGIRYWGLTVQVSSNCRELLDSLQNFWGLGSVTEWKSKKSTQSKTSYNWRLYSLEAETLLSRIRNHLIVKREQADIALEFRKYVGAYGDPVTAEMTVKRNELALRMREVNRRYGKGQLLAAPVGVR